MYQWAHPNCLIHACAQRTVIYGVVIVSRNLERANENDGFKMTALECFNDCFILPVKPENVPVFPFVNFIMCIFFCQYFLLTKLGTYFTV